MIVNRVSDVFFIYGIILILIFFKTSDYLLVFLFLDIEHSSYLSFFNFNINFVDLICFFLFLGGVGKSAQLGLHTWLPDAMEGPTPVSSLLHAATMVTAGVFLIIRCSFFFELSSFVLFLVMIIGGLTALFASLIGFFQYDLKKVIAYSTCSQLGYMFFSCGLSNYHIAIFHLFNHAFFKALLFLSAGSVIHALLDEQDMRRMGSLVNFLPFTYFFILVGSFAIMGFPFLAGFYSKDLLLELTFSRFLVDSYFVYFLGLSAAFLTSIYSVRLLLFVFFNISNSFRRFNFAYESYFEMSVSMFILGILSVTVGFIFSDLIVG
jgi:proton-translocating NADH-quinone oxidoreductase chain L